MDRANNLKKSIKNNKQIPDYIKDVQLSVLQKIYDSTMLIANNTVGHIALAYFREHQYESDADREIEQLKKERDWLKDWILNNSEWNEVGLWKAMQQALKEE